MRITIATETFAPQLNGVSRTLGQLVRVLEECGDEVQVICPSYGTAPRSPDDVAVRAIRVPFYREVYVPVPPFTKVRRAIDAFRPDLIHIATEATLGWTVLRHATRSGVPVVSSFHTNFDQYTAHYGVGWASELVWRYLRWFHNQTLETYAPSRATIRGLEARGFERLALWPRGVDSRLFRPDRPGRAFVREAMGFTPSDVVVGHVSRIATEKNVGYLGDALGIAAERFGVRLLIVGDGPARGELETKLGQDARFVGYRTGEDLADHYAAFDVFAFASRTETFGNVVLEAMASGVPVVALRAGGPGEVVQEGETGRLVDPEAPPEAFADALGHLATDEGRRRATSIAAREYALTQSWDTIMRGLRDRYQHLLNARTEAAVAMP